MESLNTKGLKRNPDVIKKYFKIIGNSTVVKGDIRVIFPARYINKNLAVIGSSVRLISIYAVVDDKGNYGISNSPIFIDLTPSNITEIEVDGVVNKVLHFDKDSVFTENNTLVKDDVFLYDLFDEYIIHGNVPWFLNYNDLSNIMAESQKYTNRDIGSNPIALEVLTAVITRAANNDALYLRQAVKTKNDLTKIKPKYVGLMNMYLTFDNTVSKLVGSYYSTGVTSAILDKEDETTTIEEILRA